MAPGLWNIAGKVACVTGASSGLGRSAATALAFAGCKVVGVARREDALREWQADVGGNTACVVADLGDRTQFGDTLTSICKPFGSVDILINAAGLNTRAPADTISYADWDRTLELNLNVPFFLAQALVPAMKEKRWGRIVNFASLQSERAMPNGISYGASKGGIAQVTRAMAEAWSKHGVTANALAPGFFRTELTGPVFQDPVLSQKLSDQTCIGRNGDPADLDGPLLFFCSDASAYVTGQVLYVDGGFTAK
jgi:gluconate 5-dehydrogenase/2-deoxy-D-gluconate 3-dehydrogenase